MVFGWHPPHAGTWNEIWTRASNYVHTKYHSTCTYLRIQYNRYWAPPPSPPMSNSYEFVTHRA